MNTIAKPCAHSIASVKPTKNYKEEIIMFHSATNGQYA